MLPTILAVIAAGIAGALANVLGAMVLIGTGKWTLLMVPARYAVAIALVLVIPVFLRLMRPTFAVVLSLMALTLLPSLNAKLVLGAGAPWSTVLVLNGVYAVVAVAVYMAAARPVQR